MTLRWPERLSSAGSTSANPIELEILAEKASALGRAGERVEQTLGRLRLTGRELPDRKVRLQEASEAVYAYFIQRELCGFRRHQDAIREYAIPNEVLARLGAK